MTDRKKRQPQTLADWMNDRRLELSMSWDEVEKKAGVTKNTMLSIRRGDGDSYPKTIRNVEAALGWALGSISAIKAGREPRVVDVDAVIARQTVDVDDPAVQLRALLRRMGPTAFWREIGVMHTEGDTESHRAGGG